VVPMLDEPTAADPRVLLIRQFRHAADGFIWEIPAGTLDAGEDPATCAARELLEEAGCVARQMTHLSCVFTTSCLFDEPIYVFHGSGHSRRKARSEHDEFITVHECP